MPVEIQEVSADIAPSPRAEGGADDTPIAQHAEVLAEKVERELAAAERRRLRLFAD